MSALSIQEAKLANTLHQILPQYNPVLHLKAHQLPHPTPKSLMDRQVEGTSSNAEKTPFASGSLNVYQWESAPQHETDLFTHVRGLLYKHVTDSGQKFLALVIPKSWKYTVLVEAHDKLGHWGNTCTYCLIKQSMLLERNEQGY